MTTPAAPAAPADTVPVRPYQAAPSARPRRQPALPWSRDIWREYGYLLLQLLVCGFALAYILIVPPLAAGLLVTVVGLFAAGALVVGARGWGAMYRSFDAALLGSDVPPPPAFVRPRGFWRSLGAMLGDGTGWRALLYMFVSFPLALFTSIVSTVWLAVGAGGVTYWIWWRFLPAVQMYDGTYQRGAVISNDDWYWVANTPGRIALVAVVGAAFLFMWAPITRGFAKVFAVLGRGLLGPTAGSVRVAQLRASRAAVVTDADARLRQIERDLHDGTQARLVAVAMQVGEARELLTQSGDGPSAAALLGTAHASLKDALTELRDIARGIHPPALDAGLGVALTTLAARSPLPVTVTVSPQVEASEPLPQAVASIAYYSVAELLTNVAKHAGASQATVTVDLTPATTSPATPASTALQIAVSDNGHGGASIHPTSNDGRHTGLAGLADRVAAIDGSLTITSPIGGPTAVTLTLPVALIPASSAHV